MYAFGRVGSFEKSWLRWKKRKEAVGRAGGHGLWGSSLRVAEADVSAEVPQNDRRIPSVSLFPHELVHVTGDHVCHRKNRPPSRYPFRGKTVSVITEYPGVSGTPL